MSKTKTKAAKDAEEIGAMRQIELANPMTLYGVLSVFSTANPEYIKNIPGNTLTTNSRSLFNKLSKF